MRRMRFFKGPAPDSNGPEGQRKLIRKTVNLPPEMEALLAKLERVHFSFSLGTDLLEQGQAIEAREQFRETLAKCEAISHDTGDVPKRTVKQ